MKVTSDIDFVRSSSKSISLEYTMSQGPKTLDGLRKYVLRVKSLDLNTIIDNESGIGKYPELTSLPNDGFVAFMRLNTYLSLTKYDSNVKRFGGILAEYVADSTVGLANPRLTIDLDGNKPKVIAYDGDIRASALQYLGHNITPVIVLCKSSKALRSSYIERLINSGLVPYSGSTPIRKSILRSVFYGRTYH